MLVCWEWLSQYVKLNVDADKLAHRFAMSGLNHESTAHVGTDTVIDLEVTSNRGDCLGHIGVAREASVLLDVPLHIPTPKLNPASESIDSLLQVSNQFANGCGRYTARVIRGVKVGPSPEWLSRRLKAIGIASVNNVVDVTNYVMMECGQPLHAFDLKHIRGKKIIVRPARAGEKFLAIDHRTYELDEQMIVIADAERAVALGGVMGGADSEVSSTTTELLIESAAFEPLSVRRTARKLKLQSPSSYRFERRPDPAGLDWASQRCCELIVQVAGGSVCNGMIDTAGPPTPRQSIPFRLGQIERVLGISVPATEVNKILSALGCDCRPATADTITVTPPSWRPDLSREIDLVEEVARIHGYEKIPENVPVPLTVAPQRPKDIAMRRARHVLSAYGVDEAMTPSVVQENLDQCGSVWTEAPAITTETPLLVGAKHLRRSLIPSLLQAMHTNQSQAIRNVCLYEVATIYLPGANPGDLPREKCALGIVVTSDLPLLKGIVEDLIEQIVPRQCKVRWSLKNHAMFLPDSSQQIELEGDFLGVVGVLHGKIQARMGLDHAVAFAELDVDMLSKHLQEVRRAEAVSPFPAVARDLNFVVDEALRWSELSEGCRTAGGEFLQQINYCETYRDANKDGPNKKRVLLTLQFQSKERTLTSDDVDREVAQIVQYCGQQFSARLLA